LNDPAKESGQAPTQSAQRAENGPQAGTHSAGSVQALAPPGGGSQAGTPVPPQAETPVLPEGARARGSWGGVRLDRKRGEI